MIRLEKLLENQTVKKRDDHYDKNEELFTSCVSGDIYILQF